MLGTQQSDGFPASRQAEPKLNQACSRPDEPADRDGGL